MNTLFKVAVLLIVALNSSEPKEESKSAAKSKQHSERNNVLISPVGSPNIQSSSGSPPSNLKIPSSSESSNSRKHSPAEFNRELTKIDDRSYCEVTQPDVECSKLDGDCLKCDFDAVKNTCIYGKNVTVSCQARESVVCQGERKFEKEIVCQYCYQTPIWQQRCNGMALCNSVGAPRNYFRGNCTIVPEVLCLGNRRFHRMIECNWKNGYKWSTTFFLSVTLGGFGADRFYLGRWQEGIGKLFSFGGLGLWTFVDIILIGVRYLGPADGSIYVD